MGYSTGKKNTNQKTFLLSTKDVLTWKTESKLVFKCIIHHVVTRAMKTKKAG